MSAPLPANDEVLLSRRELGEILKLSEATLRNWACKRAGPPFLRIGPRRVAYRAGDVRRWLGKALTRSDQR